MYVQYELTVQISQPSDRVFINKVMMSILKSVHQSPTSDSCPINRDSSNYCGNE